MIRTGILSFATALMVVSLPAFATEAEVLAADQARIDALVEGNVEKLDLLVAEEGVHVNSSGESKDKKQFLDDTRNRKHSFPRWDILSNKITMFGPNAALAFGHYRNGVAGDERGERYRYARHTRTWIKRDGRWQLLTHQATEMRTPKDADFPKNEADR